MTDNRNSTNTSHGQPEAAAQAQTPLQADRVVQRSKRIIPPPSVGSGFVVICRDAETGVLKRFGRRPYEHTTEEEALSEAERLATTLGQGFSVFQQIASVPAPMKFLRPVEAPGVLPPEPAPVVAAQIEKKPVRRPVVVERRVSRRSKVGGQS